MRKQLQHTTIVVLVLLVVLASALYAVNNASFGENQLTAATIATTAIDCDVPVNDVPVKKDASSLEKKQYDEQCGS